MRFLRLTRPELRDDAPRPTEAAPAGIGCRKSFVFVRGHPRSGTNWVSNLLELHPRVCCAGEFHFETIYNAIQRTKSVPWQLTGREPVATELEEAFRDMVRRCISAACRQRRPDAEWFGDRTPSDLLYWMPGARYIWVLRDGRDVAVSWTFHQLRKGPGVIKASIPEAASAHLLRLTDRFAAEPKLFERHPELLLGDELWVRHVASTWDRRFRSDWGAARHIESPDVEGEVLRARYEDLHADTEGQRVRLMRFLDLDPDEAAPASQETYTTAGYETHDPTKYRRKGEVGDWRNYFTPDAERWFNEVAGESLARAGYSAGPLGRAPVH